MDKDWWEMYASEVGQSFVGERVSNNPISRKYNVTRCEGMKTFGNSGAAAIQLAEMGGAERIVLLGYDCQHTGGKKHWHGDHPKGLGNARAVDSWKVAFENLAKELSAEVINCSRETALECFPRVDLEEALAWI